MGLIALAQVGSRGGSNEPFTATDAIRRKLLGTMSRGRSGLKPWSALALGVFGHALLEQGQSLDSSTSDVLRTELAKNKRPAEVGAYALALGLRRESKAAELLVERYGDFSDNLARGHIAVAIGLAGDSAAIEALSAVVAESRFRPDQLATAAMALALLGDHGATEQLVGMLADASSSSSLASITAALGWVGDVRAVLPLTKLIESAKLTDGARAFGIGALGMVCDARTTPWNAALSLDVNYRVLPGTLSFDGNGVLDLF